MYAGLSPKTFVDPALLRIFGGFFLEFISGTLGENVLLGNLKIRK